MEKSKQHKAALYWAGQGMHVFPCHAQAKQPVFDGGYAIGTTDVEVINAWWAENPEYNPAASPEYSGLCVIDIDDKPGQFGSTVIGTLEIEHGDLPPTMTTKTPTGGRHLFFKGTLPSTAGKIGKSLDTRGVGGYVLLPGSRITDPKYDLVDAPYTMHNPKMDCPDLPEWVGTLAFAKKIKEHTIADTDDQPHNIKRATKHLEMMVKRGDVAIEGEGGDDKTYRTLCVLKDIGLSSDRAVQLLEEVWNPHCNPPWDREDLEVHATNVWEYSQNETGSKGLTDPTETFADFVMPESNRPAAKSGPNPYKLRRVSEQRNRPKPTWIVKDRIPTDSTVMVYGSPNSFKSFIVLNEMLALADGTNGFELGSEREPLNIVYAAGEGGIGIDTLRTPAWCEQYEVNLDNLEDHYLSSDRLPPLNQSDEVQTFLDAFDDEDFTPDIVVLDTMSRLMLGMNENDTMDAGIAISCIDAIRDHFKCTVIVIHHTSKEDKGPRGSSAFFANIDVIYKVEGEVETLSAKMICEKMKDASNPEVLYVKGDEVQFTTKQNERAHSLVFRKVDKSEYQDLTRSAAPLQRSEIGEVLYKLEAFPPQGVSTRTLASELTAFIEGETPNDTRYRETVLMKVLASRAKKDLKAYVISMPEETTLRWGVPMRDSSEGSESNAEKDTKSTNEASLDEGETVNW